ncbi:MULTISPECIES: hypothetical protein [Bacillota]|uniref:Uncharacterized protein n=1 Tax=Symbiobacterium thermophilum TaxID=2734 RepID=A0A953IFM8_SYMTR|nr:MULTISPECIES: hypothetical protein [Bacillota]AEH46506.1 hypothetical protein Geoth_0472 [Parageobacillus thermoglucosidasius C56-YS93]MBY6278499.1 hypothetical protein [Symbiobacterium thermophilum]RDE32906.1 hypothetical protein DV713_13895 [Parageobacillus thermoglucosidasius]GMO00034.1 hypothetical protein PthstB1num2_20730 [Parageobacillus thermoglucosidasius]
MIIASNIEEIENFFDFTDSIVTDVKWVNNLTDLSISLDYYWDIQDGKSETRELTLVFKDCLKVEFNMPNEFIQLSKEGINFDSWFTIVLFEREDSNQHTNNGLHQINIYTFDYTNPWVKILCKEIILEQKSEIKP